MARRRNGEPKGAPRQRREGPRDHPDDANRSPRDEPAPSPLIGLPMPTPQPQSPDGDKDGDDDPWTDPDEVCHRGQLAGRLGRDLPQALLEGGDDAGIGHQYPEPESDKADP